MLPCLCQPLKHQQRLIYNINEDSGESSACQDDEIWTFYLLNGILFSSILKLGNISSGEFSLAASTSKYSENILFISPDKLSKRGKTFRMYFIEFLYFTQQLTNVSRIVELLHNKDTTYFYVNVVDCEWLTTYQFLLSFIE